MIYNSSRQVGDLANIRREPRECLIGACVGLTSFLMRVAICPRQGHAPIKCLRGFALALTTRDAARRWSSVEGSSLHEQARGGAVGECLEPGGRSHEDAARSLGSANAYRSRLHTRTKRKRNRSQCYGRGCALPPSLTIPQFLNTDKE
jgi:hypothetical protein